MSSLDIFYFTWPGWLVISYLICTKVKAIKKFHHAPCDLPYGLAVRIPGFHPGGPGSTPGMGTRYFFFFFNSERLELPTFYFFFYFYHDYRFCHPDYFVLQRGKER